MKFQKRVWGVPGKMNVYYSPGKFQMDKRIVPLNENPLEAWDTNRSRYRRVDLVPREIQQMDGINESSNVPQPTATPSPSPTPVPLTWDTYNQNWENITTNWENA